MTFLKTLALAALMAFAANAAGIEGKWTAEFDTQIGVQKYAYEFKLVNGHRVSFSGTYPRAAGGRVGRRQRWLGCWFVPG